MASSAANRRRICSSALGGTIRSAVAPRFAGASIFASRWPFVATMRIRSGRSSHNTPFRIGQLSSVDAANATWPTSLCTVPAAAFQAPSNLTTGNEGNSSRGRPSSLNLDRPHSMPTRASPAAANRTGPAGSSRAMSTSFLAGSVTAPSTSTSADTVVLTAMSRSVPERRMPCFVASSRTLARTGSVVLAGIAAAASPRSARLPTPTNRSLPTCWLECGQLLPSHLDTLLERAVSHHLPLYLVDRVDHGRVVPSSERLTDLHQLHAQHVARQIHRDLSRDRQRLGAGLGAQPLGRHPPATGHHFLDAIDARRGLRAVARGVLSLSNLVRERLTGELDRHLAVLERREQQQFDDAALELPHARAHVLGDETQHVVRDRELEMVLLRLLPQNGDAVLQVRVPDVGEQPPLEARDQPIFQPGEIGRASCRE